MKPIPEKLQAYFPKASFPPLPWWTYNPLRGVWERGVHKVKGTPVDMEAIDRAHPMQPPPILVGQVWAIPTSAPGAFFIASVVAVELRTDGRRGIHWSGFAPSHPMLDVHPHGFLISCPFGYAPWSGPEVP